MCSVTSLVLKELTLFMPEFERSRSKKGNTEREMEVLKLISNEILKIAKKLFGQNVDIRSVFFRFWLVFLIQLIKCLLLPKHTIENSTTTGSKSTKTIHSYQIVINSMRSIGRKSISLKQRIKKSKT